MTIESWTFLFVLAGLYNLWLQVYNRWLISIRDSPAKPVWLLLWAALCLIIAPALLVLGWDSMAVQQALSWRPETVSSRILFGLLALLWVFALWRLGCWTMDRLAPRKSERLVSERVRIPMLQQPERRRLPRTLAMLDTTYDLEIVEREIIVPEMAAAFDGLTIAHVSDVHYEFRHGEGVFLRQVAGVVNEAAADIVAFTGDFTDHDVLIPFAVRYHSGMRGRLATVAVMGNHDHWVNPRRLDDHCRRRRIRLMRHRRWSLDRGGRRLHIVGTDAPWDGDPYNWGRLLEKGPGEAIVLLSHSPDNAPAAAQHGANLVLSGHNHGGQYCLPLIGPIVVPSRTGHRFVRGVYDVGPRCVLNVSRGIGVSTMGGRILCPPEVVLLTLRSPAVEVEARQLDPAQNVEPSMVSLPG